MGSERSANMLNQSRTLCGLIYFCITGSGWNFMLGIDIPLSAGAGLDPVCPVPLLCEGHHRGDSEG